MKIWFLILGILFGGSASAADAPLTEFQVCLEDKPVFLLYNSPGLEDSPHPGILIEFLKIVTKKLSIKLDILRRPATACRVLMKAGTVHGYGIISHLQEREEWAVYPRLPNGAVDPAQIFNRAGYFLYSRSDRQLPWDGKTMESLKGLRIGSSEGYSINDELKKGGVYVETFKSMDAMYTRLQDKQLDGVAMHSNRIDKKAPKMGLRKYEHPLKMNDYYFTFSKPFYKDNQAICEKIWAASVNFEQTPEGKKILERYENLIDFPR